MSIVLKKWEDALVQFQVVIISLRNFGQLCLADLVFPAPDVCRTHPAVHSNAQPCRSALPALGHKAAMYHILWSWVLEYQVLKYLKTKSSISTQKTIKSKNRQSMQGIKGPVCDSLCRASSGRTHHEWGSPVTKPRCRHSCRLLHTTSCTLVNTSAHQCTLVAAQCNTHWLLHSAH